MHKYTCITREKRNLKSLISCFLTHLVPPGISILEKLHSEEKYFGRKDTEARLDCSCLFLVPWHQDGHEWRMMIDQSCGSIQVTWLVSSNHRTVFTWPMEKMCTVPWSLATQRRLLSLLKFTQKMFAGCDPLEHTVIRFTVQCTQKNKTQYFRLRLSDDVWEKKLVRVLR